MNSMKMEFSFYWLKHQCQKEVVQNAIRARIGTQSHNAERK